MKLREFCFMVGLIAAVIPALYVVAWLCDAAAGTGWAAPAAAMILLLAFVIDFGVGKAKVP